MVRLFLVAFLALSAYSQPVVRPTTGTAVIATYPAGSLPTAATPGRVAFVTGALSNASCSIGGGSVVLFCRDNGSAWLPAGDGSSAGSGATHYSGSSALDLPSVPDGTCHLATTAITVTNAALGHRAVVGMSAALPEGISATAIVTGPNSMKVQLCNLSGAAYDPALITYTLGVVL